MSRIKSKLATDFSVVAKLEPEGVRVTVIRKADGAFYQAVLIYAEMFDKFNEKEEPVVEVSPEAVEAAEEAE